MTSQHAIRRTPKEYRRVQEYRKYVREHLALAAGLDKITASLKRGWKLYDAATENQLARYL